MKLIKLDLLDGLAKPYISVRAEDFERIARYLRDANNAIEQQPASTSAQVTITYDLSAVAIEGKLQEALIALGWTPPQK